MKKQSIALLFVMALAFVLLVTAVSPVFAGRPTPYWSGGTKLTFTPDAYGHINITWPACETSVDTYLWTVYDPNGDWFAGSNNVAASGQFTPTIPGRYKVTVDAMVGSTAVDSIKGAYRYVAP